MQHHASVASLSALRIFFFFPWIWVSVCAVEYLPEGDRLIAWQLYWWTNWRPFSHLSLAWLRAILISLFITSLTSPITSLLLQRDLQCDCDKHLSFSFSIFLLLLVASAYIHSVFFSHLPFCSFFFFNSLSFHFLSFYYCGVFFTSALFWHILQNDCDWHTQRESHSFHDF